MHMYVYLEELFVLVDVEVVGAERPLQRDEQRVHLGCVWRARLVCVECMSDRLERRCCHWCRWWVAGAADAADAGPRPGLGLGLELGSTVRVEGEGQQMWVKGSG